MKKLVKGLLLGLIVLNMVGCEEAKQVEDIQINSAVEENIEKDNKVCQYCEEPGHKEEDCKCICYDCGIEMHPSAMIFDGRSYVCKPCNEVRNLPEFNCINCGKLHKECDSYYNEDGMSVCSEACFNAFQNANAPANNAKYKCLDCCGIYNEDEMINSVRCKNCYDRLMQAEIRVINPSDPSYNHNQCVSCGSYNIGLNDDEFFNNKCLDCGANFN